MQHRERILLTTNGYVPICSCNWVGKDYQEREQAWHAANDHVVNAARALKTQDPRQLDLVGGPKTK